MHETDLERAVVSSASLKFVFHQEGVTPWDRLTNRTMRSNEQSRRKQIWAPVNYTTYHSTAMLI